MNIPVMLLIIVIAFAFIVLMSALIKRKRNIRLTVNSKGKLLYEGNVVRLDEFEKAISE